MAKVILTILITVLPMLIVFSYRQFVCCGDGNDETNREDDLLRDTVDLGYGQTQSVE